MKKQLCHHARRLFWGAAGTCLLWGCVGCGTAEGQEKDEETKRSPAPSALLDAVRVQVAPVAKTRFEGRTVLSGLAEPKKSATAAAEVRGRLVKNRCTVGREVRKNEPIYQVDTSNIRLQVRQATEALAARKTDAEFSARELARSEELVQANAQPEQALTKSRYDRDKSRHSVEAAETALLSAEKNLRDAVIRAPFAGTIAQCLAEKGDYVGPGTPVFKIVDLSEIRLEAGVPAALTAALRLNVHAKTEFEALGGAARDAILIETSPSPNPQSGTYPARFAVENKDRAVLEGMSAKIIFKGAQKEVLTVPQQAVFRVDGEPRVFVVRKNRAVEHPVHLGAAENGRVEIVSGLKKGEQVVTDGMFALTDGRAVMVEQQKEEE